MIKAIHCNTHEHTFHHLTSIDQISEIKDHPDSVTWLDLQNPTEQDLKRLGQTFNLHPLSIEDASHEHQRPKIEDYQHFYFIVFYAVNPNQEKGEPDTHELDMFLGKNYLITVHHEPAPELEEVEQRWTRESRQIEAGTSILLYLVLDTIVDRYFPVVDMLVDQAEDLEERLFTRGLRETVLTRQLLELRRRFLVLRRLTTPERDVLNVLTNRENPLLDEHAAVYFRDIYDHITRLAETLDLYRDRLSTTMDANLSIVSNDLNKVMRTLTVASIILMVDSLIAGIYGMNFVNIPELHWQGGYFYALILMAALSILLIVYFKHRDWL